jgi:hypothetical protein
MVIVSNKSGQLANRLILFAHFIANAKEYGYQVSNPSFYHYSHYFPSIRNDFFCCYPARDSRLKARKPLQWAFFKTLKNCTSLYEKLGLKVNRFAVLDITASDRGSEIYELSCPEFANLREAAAFLFVKGWLFRDSANFKKHADLLRHFFAPAKEHAANVSRLMERARQDCDLLVGVHVRQGDYRKWQKGKHYYTSEEYAAAMRRFSAASDAKRVKFLICSNEAQDERLFAGLNYVLGNNHQLEDLYSFARCDLLIGPPSTYTLWASFYGAVPLFVLETAATPILADGFQIFEG